MCRYDLHVFVFSSRRLHTRCALVTGVQTCALPISPVPPWQPKGSTMATKGRVEGKVVLITGAAHGLGKADAEALAREGARVIVADVDEEEAQRVADMLPAAMALRLDVTCEAQWQAALTKIMHAYGRLDALEIGRAHV